MTFRSFTLSFAAMDILFTEHRLGLAPFPFEIPGHGRTLAQRADIRRAVFADLERRNLAVRGRIEPDVEEALALLVRPRLAITGFGDLGGGHTLCARLGALGNRAVVAVRQGQTVRFDAIRETALVSTAVGLLPQHRPGPGQSVTIELTAPPAEAGAIEPVRPHRTSRSAQARAVQAMLAPPKLRLGQLQAHARDRHGRQSSAPCLFWFDTADGRYLTVGSARADGARWTTYAPADNQRIARHLSGQLAHLTG
ncbi:ESX secretion-associated protein EspG [Actinokineospora iranica]|uniref:EspG family protein n=1 Tax=Actinokineospora iranica TaxID=1271860 RepID=A0A1G6Z0M0_9PSEU|nr:ESX secretion-associated protein EspG [Actinokineospora iranica]SDD95457.1 EspG family protein [Actinokineospora iranica]